MNIEQLKEKCEHHRKKVLEICLEAKTGHVTSSMSCVELLVALYYSGTLRHFPNDPQSPKRDRFILSKAQASPLLYSVLSDCGYFGDDKLHTFAKKDGFFGVHLQNSVPGVETTAGALGHGLGLASGMALAAKQNRDLHLVYTMLGDGELYEGSIWESLMFASHNNLNNLVGIIDRNYLCTTDFTENIIELEPLEERIAAFGWNVVRIDGHDMEQIITTLHSLRSRPSRKPTMIIAETVKGKGLECMSYQPLCHGIAPNGEVAELAKKELGL